MTGLSSVIIPTYNRAGQVLRALSSVKSQSYRPVEVIVVDDGSTDDTRDAVNGWKARNSEDMFYVHYFHKENGGPASARNMGLRHAGGEYIYFLDSDDYMYGNLLEDAVKTLESENSDCVIFGFDFTKAQGAVGQYLPPPELSAPEAFFQGRLWGYTPSVLRRSELAHSVGEWNEYLFIAEDYEYLGRTLLRSLKSSVLPKRLLCVSRDNNSLGSAKDSRKGLESRLSAESVIVRLIKNKKGIADSLRAAYASRLYKTAIHMYARNESHAAKELGLLAEEIDCGPHGILDKCKRLVWRQGKELSYVWCRLAAVFSFFRRKLKKIRINRVGRSRLPE
ncbi:MAG: glycosyltransferase family 2 protein [Desulfosalsimonadaceae bacterium]|nr:glycosyltransferase family 2 protein [Desulfosalsimonadaceae bacterium]